MDQLLKERAAAGAATDPASVPEEAPQQPARKKKKAKRKAKEQPVEEAAPMDKDTKEDSPEPAEQTQQKAKALTAPAGPLPKHQSVLQSTKGIVLVDDTTEIQVHMGPHSMCSAWGHA